MSWSSGSGAAGLSSEHLELVSGYQRLTTSKAEASPSGSSLDSIKGELQEYLGAD